MICGARNLGGLQFTVEVYIGKIQGNQRAEQTTFKLRGSEERIFYARVGEGGIFKMQKTSEERGNN